MACSSSHLSLLIPSEMATYAGGANTEENNQTVLSTLPKELPLDFLRTITDQFSDNRVIGKGAFGTVYTVCSRLDNLLHFRNLLTKNAEKVSLRLNRELCQIAKGLP